MDTFHVLKGSLGRADLVFSGERGVLVAIRAGFRKLPFINATGRVRYFDDIVRAVAVPTLCGSLFASRQGLPMHAFQVRLEFRFVALVAL